jgi:hypothetical protein
MTDGDKPTQPLTTAPTRQSEAIDGRSAPLKVTGKLKTAIEQMVWHGARRAEAAEKAGLKDHSLRAALRKTHVMAHYHAELGVLRESTRAKNFHRLDGIAEDSPNAMAKVAAIKVMEAISEPLASVAQGQPLAGYVIDIGPDPVGLSVRIVSPMPRRQGDDAIEVSNLPPREAGKDGR